VTPDRSWMRKTWSRINSAILRGLVGRSKDATSLPLVQVEWTADRTSDEVEYMQPQGLYFRPKVGAEGLFLAAAGDRAAAVLVDAQKRDDTPGGDGIGEGEGGLYYAGTFGVFLDSTGKVHLGAKSGSDFVALAAKVKSELDGIKSDLDAVKLWAGASGHTHVCAAPGSPSDHPVPPLVLTYSPTSPAATKVKAT